MEKRKYKNFFYCNLIHLSNGHNYLLNRLLSFHLDSYLVNIRLTRCWLNHFLIFFSGSGVGIGIGIERQSTIWRQNFTVGEHGMEYVEVKTDPDSDTDANPD